MELVLTLPILLAVLLGLFEFSILFFARSTVVEACRLAARKASLPGVAAEDVESEVTRRLSPRMGRSARVRIEMGQQTGDVVIVAVSVPMDQAAPNLLWPIGYGLTGRTLYAETQMIKE